MSHIVRDKKKLINRVKRIQGQMDGVLRALEEDKEPEIVMQSIASIRGALNGLMYEIVEGHVNLRVLDPSLPEDKRADATSELLDVLKSYMK